ncbi:hypothetical protein LguiA_017223 [Lonicera macranthoides]
MVSCSDHDLPEDLLIQILSRLPVKSLVCCKCVCLYWNALIESPMFITTHFNHPKNHTRLLVHYYKERRYCRFDSAFDLYPNDETVINNGSELPVREDIDNPLVKTTYPLPKLLSSSFSDIFGPVNGLFLVHYVSNPEADNVALWNPATKEFRTLPAPAFNLPPTNYTYNGLNFGFGLDPFTNDYKVVLILFYVEEKNRMAIVIVYSLATNSWRLVDDVLPSVSGIFNTYNDKITTRGRNCTYLNGGYYWMSRDQGDDSLTRIVMFDMAKEVFRDIEPPPCNTKRSPSVFFELMLWNDNVALLLSKYTGTFLDNVEIWKGMILESIEVWIMEGEGHHWTKHLIYGPHIHVLRPLGFSRNGNIFMGTCSFNLLLYNPNKHEVRDFGTKGRKLKVFNYKETVAPIMPRSRKLKEVNPTTGFIPFHPFPNILSLIASAPAPTPA